VKRLWPVETLYCSYGGVSLQPEKPFIEQGRTVPASAAVVVAITGREA
jgi:hypothetical protein